VELRPVQLGKASYPNLISKLSFVKNKQAASTYLRGAPANYGQPISEADYNLIFEELRKNPIIEKVEPQKPPEIKIRSPEVESIPSHNEIRDIICEIGKFEGKICEKEYIIDSLRLDVAWKRIAAGIPSHAFEVQLGGNFFEALTKLKHAWDKWNSKPILVTTERYAEEAKQLLSGSFHEMKDVARIIHWKKIVELHRLLKDVAKIKCEVGL
jgi:predicted RNA-binding protein